MYKRKTKNIFFIIIFIISISMILIGLYLNFKTNKTKDIINSDLYSIEIEGYTLDKPFNKNEYNYSVNVVDDYINVLCDILGKVDGCNEEIDLTNKEVYEHKIVLNVDDKKEVYTIKINKIIEDVELKIISVSGNANEWTNEDIELSVNAIATKGISGYSFDGGNSFQESNKIIIKENQTVNIVVKDKDGNISEAKEVIVDKIDKDVPTVEVVIDSKTRNEVKLKINAIDNLSGIKGISFNNSEYSNNNIYTVIKPGKYTVKVMDNAGNQSQEIIKEIKDSDFEKVVLKTFEVTFDNNGTNMDTTYSKCTTESNGCKVKAPNIIKEGYQIIGWSTNKDAKTAQYKVGADITVTRNQTYYAITKKVVTVTFNVGVNPRTCTIYNKQTECSITMPEFNIVGSLNGAWGPEKENTSAKYKVGTTFKFSKDMNLYASIRHPWGDDPEHIYKKVRNFDMNTPIAIGNKIIEYETRIPQASINEHKAFLKTLYNDMPCLFVPGKVFVLMYDNYENYSLAYGLTHMYGSYSFVDVQYDKNKIISLNATVHEFAHTWDHYYSFKTGKTIQSQPDFVEFYKSIESKLTIDNPTEIFAAMVTNYYWHVLEKDTTEEYYGMCSGCQLNTEEKNWLRTIIEKYIKISNNGY